MYLAKRIEEQMHDNVDIGQGFQGKGVKDRFDRVYEKGYAAKRKKAGFQVAHTDLQRDKKRIKGTHVESQKGAVIFFEQGGGDIFKYHHTGKAKGGKVRSIFPKEGSDSLPQDIIDDTTKRLTAKLRGK